MANGHGGTRQGAGRKTNEVHIIRRTIEENGIEDAQAAFSLLVSMMNNPANPAKLRVEVAQMIMDRVLGKPQQRVAGSWEGGVIPVQLTDIDYRADLDGGEDAARKGL